MPTILAGYVHQVYNPGLNDGREFKIVKVYREPEEYRERLAEMGWDAEVESTENYLIYGSGTLKSGR